MQMLSSPPAIGSDVDMVEMEIAKLRNLMGARPLGALPLWEEFELISLGVVSLTKHQVSVSQLKESVASAACTVVQEELLSGDVYDLLELGYSFASCNTNLGSKVHGDVLEHRLQALESRASSSVGTMPAGSVDRVAELERRSLASAMTAISELKEITLSHKAELERTQEAALATDHGTMNGETFASPLVVSAYVLKHRIAGSVLWFDAFSLCQIASHDVLDHTQEALSEHANVKKAGYDTPGSPNRDVFSVNSPIAVWRIQRQVGGRAWVFSPAPNLQDLRILG